MSEWSVRIVSLDGCERLPNSDQLSIVKVDGGYPCIFRTEEFKEGDLATYVPVDSLVPMDRSEFSFLQSASKPRPVARIKARKLRGTFSMGLLVPAPEGALEGQDVAEYFGITKYLPASEDDSPKVKGPNTRPSKKSELKLLRDKLILAWIVASGATFFYFGATVFSIGVCAALYMACFCTYRYVEYKTVRPKYPMYDIDAIRQYPNLIANCEPIIVSEKLHGSNSSFCYMNGRFHMKSRTTFRGSSGGTGGWAGTGSFSFDEVWRKIAVKYDLEAKLKKHPKMVLFGEIYGHKIQDLDYGLSDSQDFRAFDVYDLEAGQFLMWDAFVQFCKDVDVPVVPVLYRGEWDPVEHLKFAEGKSLLPGAEHQVREGFVVRTTEPKPWGRTQLKMCGEGYYLRKEKEDN